MKILKKILKDTPKNAEIERELDEIYRSLNLKIFYDNNNKENEKENENEKEREKGKDI
jgi:hypothetical protein